MSSFRRIAATVLAVAVLAAGCGDDSDGEDAAEPTSTTTSPTSESATTAPTSEPSTTATEPGTATTAATEDGGGAGCRQIEHVAGTSCVPADPQRIVTLDPLMALPTLLDVGAPVVGSLSVYSAGDPFPSYIDPVLLEEVDAVGAMQTPNVEAIAAARPDLIIGDTSVVGPIYDQLSEVAPTVVTNYSFYRSDWREDVRLVAEAAGRSAAVEEQLAALDDRIAEVAAGLEAAGPHELTRVDVFEGSPLYYRFSCTFFGEVLMSAGISQPAAQGPDECTDGDSDSVFVFVSLEELEVLDADAIVAYQQQSGDEDVGADPLAALSDSPVWNALGAVQDGRVHVLGDAWGLGASIGAAHAILDDVQDTVFPAG